MDDFIHILNQMTHDDPTLNLLMLMVIVWTTGVICRKIHQPPVLGELTAGIIFGPAFLGLIAPNEMLSVLSELGVFFLMFYAGLETNPLDLKRFRFHSTCVGIAGFLIPFAVAYLTCQLFALSSIESLFISLGLSITAIAVSARILHDLELTEHHVTPVIIGASIVDDVLALSFFTAIIDLGTNQGHINWLHFGLTMGKVILFFMLAIGIGIWLYPKIGRHFSSRSSKGFTFALVMALMFGMLAEIAGLHLIIGAYMAGLFVREGVVSQELLTKISDRFVSITYGFLGPIFFVSLSFHVTFSIFKTHLLLTLVLLLAAIFGKMLGAGCGSFLCGMNRKEATVIGLAMNGRGAVELIVASIGLQLGLINDEIFSILVLIAFVTTSLPPLSMKLYLDKINYDFKT
ncbi:Kef-type K+ transport system, membrane component KefB [Malonomonas rubra DSM 5091]|uniref:Kef-type K+ transport system, membrane component KefB n=1 Tax=Malonomonas rubra DSM 5091 TaxID=1122189 RepID=A0A1M6BUC5_MALRU|nr:cation:proton antiporter [Malonomonas rubra]SHI52154.1 Kef-type K+ transport system, membrane component KefB [Malonomonas rubra DSM 5091]